MLVKITFAFVVNTMNTPLVDVNIHILMDVNKPIANDSRSERKMIQYRKLWQAYQVEKL